MSPDYIETFSKLAKKKSWEVKQEVALLLTVIDIVENGKVKNNEIRLNQELQKSFDEHCMKFLSSSLFDVYIPFWYLSRESFWHIVPLRGKDDILELIDDPDQKPSKAKLEDSVNYAELDEDLFFLMTLSSGRKQLRAALISSCFGYNEETTLALSSDHPVEEEYTDVSKLYETLKTSAQPEVDVTMPVENTDATAYNKLPTNLKIDINFSFYSYLKKHPFEQELILNVIPDIETFYNCILSKSINRDDYNDKFVSSYESLLREMKFALMSEDNSFDVIDKIGEVINSLQSKDADDSDNIATEETQENEIYQNFDVQSDTQQLSSNLKDGLKGQTSYSQEESPSFHAQEEHSIDQDSRADVCVSSEEENIAEEDDILETYKPKGKLSKIKDYTNSPYDYLWLMSIVDYMSEDMPQSSISMDELAIQMIANAWEANSIYPGTIDKLPDVKKCIEFYISESKSFMSSPLDWNSSKELILSEIKDYPVGDEVEDVMDKLVAEAPYRVDNTWIKADNMMDLIELSKEFYGRCLYGIHLRKHDSFIQINPRWIWNLYNEHEQLIRYYMALYKRALPE